MKILVESQQKITLLLEPKESAEELPEFDILSPLEKKNKEDI